VSRTVLVNRLRANTEAAVVALSAPAGYGKTTLLAQWADRDPRPFIWISIDEQDVDAIVLLRHLAVALDAIAPLSPQVLEALAAPSESPWMTVLPRLCAAVAAAQPLVLVLDDVHLLRSMDSLDAVTALADHMSEGSALVVSGRATPRLPIPALRASGRLMELGIDDLAFTPREGQRLLRSAGLHLTFDEVTTLIRECEGWPAAVYLAGLALREGEDEGRPARPAFGQLDRRGGGLAAYLRSEYLSRLRPDAVRFLRRTSVLDQMCGDLCDAVLGRRGSAGELERIERSNLFLLPLDRQRVWFRYHRLFRDVLRNELGRQEPQLVGVLHARAADWYEAHGDPEAALEHANARGDTRRVARILSAIAVRIYQSGRAHAVERWLARFENDALLERYPDVALKGSWIYALRGRRADAERWLMIAERSLNRRTPTTNEQGAWLTIVRATLGREGVYQMIADAESALAAISRDDPVRPFALMVLGVGYMLLAQDERADALFAEAIEEAQRVGATETQVVATGERSILAAAHDDVRAAEGFAHHAEHLAQEGNLEGYGTTGIAVAASARAALRHGNWAEARAALEKLGALMPSVRGALSPWYAVQTQLEFARAYLALREPDTVRSLLESIREQLQERPHVGVLAEEADALERELEAMPDAGHANPGLTAAELRLLPYLATHLSFREIGEQLYVSRNTIKTQAISVYRKLGVTSRSEAIACATRLGLVDPISSKT
jgi:LuxR family maltose regulon positive regulatory protein